MRNWLIGGVLAVLAVASAVWVEGGERGALWSIIHEQCVPHAQAGAEPTPCAVVDLAAGTALFKDRIGAGQYLVIPTDRVTGIEDPAVHRPEAAAYWRDAWRARHRVAQALGHALSRQAVGLALNSQVARSQDQLHIHVDCLAQSVIAALHAQQPNLHDDRWTAIALPPDGATYRARLIPGDDLAAANPFALLAADTAASPKEMGLHTLVVAGAVLADGGDGFILLDQRVNPATGKGGHGEDLQDHSCAVAKAP
jgi:CDP-diacylglycerol pyrophosphatase